MSDLTRRAAFRLAGAIGLFPSLFSAAAKVAPPASPSLTFSTSAWTASKSYWVRFSGPTITDTDRERLMGLMAVDPQFGRDVPCHITALRSVQPWAKVMMARANNDSKRTFIEKLEALIEPTEDGPSEAGRKALEESKT